jgi:hypothetical protein
MSNSLANQISILALIILALGSLACGAKTQEIRQRAAEQLDSASKRIGGEATGTSTTQVPTIETDSPRTTLEADSVPTTKPQSSDSGVLPEVTPNIRPGEESVVVPPTHGPTTDPVSTRTPTPTADMEEIPMSDTLLRDISTGSYCHETKIRTPVATLSWRLGESPVERIRLDVTSYGWMGFERGGYVSLDLARNVREFRDPHERKEGEKLSDALLDLTLASMDLTESGGRITVEKLHPGIHYSWRIVANNSDGQVSSPRVDIDGLTCVADFKNEEEVKQ